MNKEKAKDLFYKWLYHTVRAFRYYFYIIFLTYPLIITVQIFEGNYSSLITNTAVLLINTLNYIFVYKRDKFLHLFNTSDYIRINRTIYLKQGVSMYYLYWQMPKSARETIDFKPVTIESILNEKAFEKNNQNY